MSSCPQVNERSIRPRILRFPELKERVGLGKTALYSLIKLGLFPRQVKLMDGSRSVGWFEDEVDSYIEARKTKKTDSAKNLYSNPVKLPDPPSKPVRNIQPPTKHVTKTVQLRGASATNENGLVATGMEIMGRPVLLCTTSGKLLLDIGHVPLPFSGAFGAGPDSAASE